MFTRPSRAAEHQLEIIVMREKHTILMEDISEAMKTEIVLASSVDARTKKAKDLKFRPWDLTYRVRYFDGEEEEKKTFREVTDAIGQYNAYDA